jgi:hypothetical protein
MQGDTAAAARRHSMLSLPNASLSIPCTTSLLVQLTCTGRGESVQHSTAVYQPHSSPGLCMATVISRLGKASTVSTVKDLRPKAWTSCLFHKHVGPEALVPLLTYLELCWCIACCGARRRGDERRIGFLIKVFTIDHNRRPRQNVSMSSAKSEQVNGYNPVGRARHSNKPISCCHCAVTPTNRKEKRVLSWKAGARGARR